MIGIVDYGVGNLRNVQKALERLGYESRLSDDAAVLSQSEALILPGVGAFGDAMASLNASGLRQLLDSWVSSGKLLLGICVGMQLLFEESSEFGPHEGLGYLKGKVTGFDASLVKVPHMGWNTLSYAKESPLFAGVGEEYVYFVHSFYACPEPSDLIAYTHYGIDAAAAVGSASVYGVQFHPEKSSDVGKKILKNFVGMAH